MVKSVYNFEPRLQFFEKCSNTAFSSHVYTCPIEVDPNQSIFQGCYIESLKHILNSFFNSLGISIFHRIYADIFDNRYTIVLKHFQVATFSFSFQYNP